MASAVSQKSPPRLSEDWLATIIGLIIVVIIGSGLLGPGAQNVSVSAETGQTTSAALRPLSGWRVNATLDGEPASIEDAPTALADGQNILITCRDGELSTATAAAPPESVTPPPENRAQIVLVNECAAPVRVTYQTRALIPWPVFNLFSR